MRFRIHIVLVSILLMATSLEAQVTVRGKVSSKANSRGLSGVEVMLDPVGEVTQTDREGRFSFGKVMPGTYRLKASSPTFSSLSTVVEVNGEDLSVDFTVDSLVYALGPVEITMRAVLRPGCAPWMGWAFMLPKKPNYAA